jgi:hypothetical protein
MVDPLRFSVRRKHCLVRSMQPADVATLSLSSRNNRVLTGIAEASTLLPNKDPKDITFYVGSKNTAAGEKLLDDQQSHRVRIAH